MTGNLGEDFFLRIGPIRIDEKTIDSDHLSVMAIIYDENSEKTTFDTTLNRKQMNYILKVLKKTKRKMFWQKIKNLFRKNYTSSNRD